MAYSREPYAIALGGRERTVNSQQIEDGVLRVSGVNRQWVLRAGDSVVCIEQHTGRTGS